MTVTLGQTLKSARESISFTLRQVEEATGISNAYLSQLENDKIKKPSANVLYKLASLYAIPLNNLLKASGIITTEVEQNAGEPAGEWLSQVAFFSGDMTQSQQDDVLEYIKFVKFKKQRGEN